MSRTKNIDPALGKKVPANIPINKKLKILVKGLCEKNVSISNFF
jgi:hypothetical protein